MQAKEFRCLLVDKQGDATSIHDTTLPADRLPAGDVTLRIDYSALNYKDALACEGHPGVVKQLPHVPGIDAAGVVTDSQSPVFKSGDEVLVTGYDFGQGHWGGWAESTRVPAEWLVPLPSGLSAKEAMILGTAGFTAAQCVMALRRNEVMPEAGEIVVTGATGGVGSLAVQILGKLGYEVVAVTGKKSEHAKLIALGAKRVVERTALVDESSRPMLSAKWAGGVDTVGGDILNTLLRSTKLGGCVAACGLVAGPQLEMTVFPFLLRGVSLCGIASAECPRERRLAIWNLLTDSWKPPKLDGYVNEIQLQDVAEHVARMKAGNLAGRTLIRIGNHAS